jgi:DNA (cytosine-5)-methyltransferase 1
LTHFSTKATQQPKISVMPTAISLFSGCGGSDAGIISAGFDVLVANDVLPYARDVYLANHPATDYMLADVANIRSLPKADLLVGCYPCQGFSQGGVRDPSRKINTLYREFGRALRLVRPRAFIVENVSGMVRSNFRHLLKSQLGVFRQAGYLVDAAIFNAAEYGVAQERNRIFIVGIRSDFGLRPSLPPPTHGVATGRPLLTIKDAISHLPEWPIGDFNAEPFHWYYLSRNRRRDWNEQSKTIVANGRHMPLHPMSPSLVNVGKDAWKFADDRPARRFTYREAASLQGFGRDFHFPDSQSSSLRMKYTVVGNAVPPPLFEAVARALPPIW